MSKIVGGKSRILEQGFCCTGRRLEPFARIHAKNLPCSGFESDRSRSFAIVQDDKQKTVILSEAKNLFLVDFDIGCLRSIARDDNL